MECGFVEGEERTHNLDIKRIEKAECRVPCSVAVVAEEVVSYSAGCITPVGPPTVNKNKNLWHKGTENITSPHIVANHRKVLTPVSWFNYIVLFLNTIYA